MSTGDQDYTGGMKVGSIVFGGSSAADCDQCGARLPLHYAGCGKAQQYIQPVPAPWPAQLDAANAEIARLRADLAQAKALLREVAASGVSNSTRKYDEVQLWNGWREEIKTFLSRVERPERGG